MVTYVGPKDTKVVEDTITGDRLVSATQVFRDTQVPLPTMRIGSYNMACLKAGIPALLTAFNQVYPQGLSGPAASDADAGTLVAFVQTCLNVPAPDGWGTPVPPIQHVGVDVLVPDSAIANAS